MSRFNFYKKNQLQFKCEPKWIDNITDMKLWFEFYKMEDGKKAYEKLIEIFSSFHVLKRVTSENGIEKAEFTDKNSDKYYSHVQILLARDYFITTKYIIPSKEGFKTFTENGCKILIEIGNDSY